MNCISCGPGVTIEKGQGSCPICHKTVYSISYRKANLLLNKVGDSKGIEEKQEQTGKTIYAWAREHAAGLYAGMKELREAMDRLFVEGNKAISGNRFDQEHFDDFKQALQRYGNSENKIFLAYVKADIEVVEDAAYVPEWEKEPVQAELRV